MACIDLKDIPLSLLLVSASQKKVMDAIRTLDAYAFIITRPVEQALDLHRLIHLTTWNWLRKEGLIEQWTERTISRLEEVFPSNEHKNRNLWGAYLPHVRYTLLFDLLSKSAEIRMELVFRFGSCLCSDGRYNKAEDVLNEVTQRRRRVVLGEEHPDTLASMNNPVLKYRNQW